MRETARGRFSVTLYIFVSSSCGLKGSIRLGPAHSFPKCQWLQPRADSNGARVLEIDDSVLRDMFPELGMCKTCAELRARIGPPNKKLAHTIEAARRRAPAGGVV